MTDNALVILDATERAALTDCEATIERGLQTFVEVGTALLTIRDRRLYRAQYKTFEDYCQERWGMSRPRAYQMIDAAAVVGTLSTIVDKVPTTESQARPLTQLPPEVQPVVWQRAVETAPEGKVTAAHVQAAVNEYKNPVLQDKARAVQAMGATVFSHDSLDYYTPQWVIDAAREVMGGIDLDPASCEAANTWIMANRYYTIDQDGLSLPWYGRVWLNPPYSFTNGKSNQDAWSYRLATEYRSGAVSEGMLLVKAALGYKWFEGLWDSWPVCFVRERLSFVMPNGSDDGQSKQGTAIFYMGTNLQGFVSAFAKFGRIITPEGQYRG